MKYVLNIFLLAVLLLVGCRKENMCDCIKRSGANTVEKRVLPTFNTIEINPNIHVYLVQDTLCYAEIKAGRNLMNNIETKVDQNVLRVKNNNTCNFMRSYKQVVEVYLHFEKLNELIYQGTGPVKSVNTINNRQKFTFTCWDGVDTVRLQLNAPIVHANIHTGVADLILQGYADSLYAYARGSGCFRLQQFKCNYVYANNLSSGNFYLWAEKKLEVLLQSAGDIYYKGSPGEIIEQKRGSGKLIAFE
ncbi:MAG: DUF2807 domain-containing protein [Bacteroidia bacterium]|nr:DUF2807 domain-containing protein [Bacteroidia bacterium]